jgi:hypothetical protein
MKKSKPYITGEDRIQMKIRNPMDGKFTSKSFKYSDYNGKEGAIEASKKWAEDVQVLIDEKNQLTPMIPKIRKQRNPEARLVNTIDILKKEIHQPQQDLVSVNLPASNRSHGVHPQPVSDETTSCVAQPPAPIVVKTLIPETKAFPFKTWIPEKTGASLVISAKSKAGKTSMLHQIVKNLPKDIIKIVISPNIHNSIYDSMRNKCVYSPIFDARIIKLVQKINQKTKNHYRFVVVMDDVIDEKQNTAVLKMFLTLRNSNISAILSVQSVFLINKLIRGNANYVLLGRLSGEESIIDTYKKFLVNYKSELGIKHESDIIPIYDKLTSDYNFIFLNNLKEKIYITNKDL